MWGRGNFAQQREGDTDSTMNFWTSTVSNRYYEFIEELEGRRPIVYPDSGGEPTIGVGHLLTNSERKSGKIQIGAEVIRWSSGLTDQQIDQLIRQDTNKVIRFVNRAVKVPLSPGQFDALVSFTFNVGESAFAGSTLLRELNKGRHDRVPTQLRRWVYDNGKRIPGLERRREKEIETWNS